MAKKNRILSMMGDERADAALPVNEAPEDAAAGVQSEEAKTAMTARMPVEDADVVPAPAPAQPQSADQDPPAAPPKGKGRQWKKGDGKQAQQADQGAEASAAGPHGPGPKPGAKSGPKSGAHPGQWQGKGQGGGQAGGKRAGQGQGQGQGPGQGQGRGKGQLQAQARPQGQAHTPPVPATTAPVPSVPAPTMPAHVPVPATVTAPSTGPRPEAPPSHPVAKSAHMRRRHWGAIISFLILVVVPITVLTTYLYQIAEDQFASTTGFTVQREEGGSATDLLGGFAGLAAPGGAADTDVLYEFIQSQKIVERVDAKLDLRGHYSQHWEGALWQTDKAFSIWPEATVEELLWFWGRVVRIAYDQASGLIEIKVLAFEPDYAQAVAEEIVGESQAMINALSAAARADATRYALSDLEEAKNRLTLARQELTAFRTRTQIVDPLADLQTRLGVMNNLQQQLAQALIDFDLLRDTTSAGDPRLVQAERKITAIRERISSERETFTSDDTATGSVGEDYPTLIAEFERLTLDREYAEEAYRAGLKALEVARDNAARQSRYLATYIEPTLAQSAEYPQRLVLIGLAMLFLTLAWAIVVLIYYSIRDRR